MATLARLDTIFGSDVSGLVSGLGTIEKKVVSAQRAAESGASKISSVISGIGTAGAAVGVALAAVTVAGVGKFEQIAGEVRTLEKQLGTTAEQASVLRAQGAALGVGVDKLSVGFGIFAKHLAANDDVLADYGVTVQRTADGQIDFEAQLAQLSTIFGDMPPGLERTAAAMNLFGRSGKTLLPILSANSEELQEYAANAAAAGLIMSEDDVQAARSLQIAQRELGEAFEGLEVSLARAVIPTLIDVVNVGAKVVRAISPFLPLARDIGLAFLAWKAFTFIPPLLVGIGSALQLVGAEAAASAVATKGLGLAMLGLDSIALPIVGVFVALGGAILSVTGVIDGFGDKITEIVTNDLAPFVQAQELSERTGISMAKAFDLVTASAADTGEGVDPLADIIDNLTVHVDKAGNSVRNFAGLSNKGLKDFKQAVVESVQVSIGEFANLGEAFKTTPAQLRNQANAAVAIARQEHRDLAAIFGSKDLSEKQKQALASLPADQRHAWAEGGKAVRDQIAKDAITLQRLNNQTFHQVTSNATNKLGSGGKASGHAFGQGLADGMNASQAIAAAAAARIAHIILDTSNAVLDIQSPSREGRKIGQLFVEGVELGLGDRVSKLGDAVRNVVDAIKEAVGVGAADQARAFGHELDQISGRFERLQSKIGSLRDTIASGFDQFDLVGGAISQLDDFQSKLDAFNAGESDTAPDPLDLAGFAQDQAAQAQQLARVLTQLSKQGLNQTLLENIASEGPQGIAFGQALLNDPALLQTFNQAQQAIGAALGKASDHLISDRFGDDLQELGTDFDKLAGHLVHFLDRFDGEALKGLQRIIDRVNDLLEDLGLGAAPKQRRPHSPSTPGLDGFTAGDGRGGDTYQFSFPNYVGERRELVDMIHDGLLDKQRRTGDLGIPASR